MNTGLLTRKALQEQGFLEGSVETKTGHIKHDLFGFGDIAYCDPKRGFVIVQACRAGKDLTDHLAAYQDEVVQNNIQTFLACGGFFELWVWKMKKKQPVCEIMNWEDIT